MADCKLPSNIIIKRRPGNRVFVEPDDAGWLLEVGPDGLPRLHVGVNVDEADVIATAEEAAAAPRRLEGAPTGDTFRALMPATLFYLAAPELLLTCEREQLEESGFLAKTVRAVTN